MHSLARALIVAAATLVVGTGCAGCDDDSAPDADGGDAAIDGTVPDTAPADTTDTSEAGDTDDDIDGGRDADSGPPSDTTDTTPTDADTGGSDSQPPCRSDDQCPGNAVCDKDTGNCRIYSVVQIRDVTRRNSSSASQACGDDAAGSDLFELELQGPFGTARGYGKALKVKSTASTNTKASTVFDGSSNSLRQTRDGGLCPSAGFGPNSVLSLGCDGTLLVVFTDGGGNVEYLGSGQRLVVHEYGRQCCDGSCPKEYWEVRVCSAQSPQSFQNKMPDSNGHWPTCKTQILGVGSGRDSVTLRLPRP